MTAGQLKHKYMRLHQDAYFTIDARPVPGLFMALPELNSVLTGAYDPCCGGGHMVEDIKQQGVAVYGSDLVDYGYKDQWKTIDFMDVQAMPLGCNGVISNFPFNRWKINQMIDHALQMVPFGGIVALLFNHKFDAAGGRANLFSLGSGFYARVNLPFRIQWFPKTTESRVDPAQDHTWFIWLKGWNGDSKSIYLGKQDFDHYPADPTRPINLHLSRRNDHA